MTPPNIKKKYRRAIVLVHPDKQKGKDAAQVMLAERVFEKLKVRTLTYCASPSFRLHCCQRVSSGHCFAAVCAVPGKGRYRRLANQSWRVQAEWAKIQDEVGDTAAPVTQEASGPVNAAWGVDNSDEVKGD